MGPVLINHDGRAITLTAGHVIPNDEKAVCVSADEMTDELSQISQSQTGILADLMRTSTGGMVTCDG